MDASAIEQIQQAATTDIANKNIDMFGEMKPTLALPNDFVLHDMEAKKEFRFRFRGEFATESVSAFGDYAQQHTIEDSQAVFIHAESMTAKLVLNLGDEVEAGHCDHVARIKLVKTAAYTALLDIINRPKDQREIAEFIEDWRTLLAAYGEESETGDAPLIPIVKALQAVRSITIEAVSKSESDVRNYGATTTGMDSIDAKSKHELPSAFAFTCEPYHGLQIHTFDLRPSILTTGKTPQLVLRIIREQEHNEQMAEEFQQLIVNELAEKSPAVKTYIGTFSA